MLRHQSLHESYTGILSDLKSSDIPYADSEYGTSTTMFPSPQSQTPSSAVTHNFQMRAINDDLH